MRKSCMAILFSASKIKNVSHKTRTMLLDELPWHSVAFAWTILGVSSDYSDDVAVRQSRLESFGPDSIDLKPGETIGGDVELKQTFGLEGICQRGNVLIFWFFNPFGSSRGSTQKHGGWVAFERDCKSIETSGQ